MALNDLLHRHQVSLMRADAAVSFEARATHREYAFGFAAQIHDLRTDAGATAVEVLRVT